MPAQHPLLDIPAAMPPLELLENPVTNKGTAFTQAERDALVLNSLLPPCRWSVMIWRAVETQLDV